MNPRFGQLPAAIWLEHPTMQTAAVVAGAVVMLVAAGCAVGLVWHHLARSRYEEDRLDDLMDLAEAVLEDGARPVNDTSTGRWAQLDNSAPADRYARMSRARNEQLGRWMTELRQEQEGRRVVTGFERLLEAEASRAERQRQARTEGWTLGEPGV